MTVTELIKRLSELQYHHPDARVVWFDSEISELIEVTQVIFDADDNDKTVAVLEP